MTRTFFALGALSALLAVAAGAFGAHALRARLVPDMQGVFENMKCPYLILHGGHDVLGVQAAREGYEYAKKVGVDVTFMLVESDMTGAEHCQHDNPTLGQELMIDWLADKFGIDQRKL